MSNKKKKERTTIIALVVILAVVCIGYFALVKHNDDKEKAADTSVNLLQLDSSLATKLDITNENGELSFELTDGIWTLTSDADFVVDQDVIQTLLDEFADLTASQMVVDNQDSLADYGLEEPAATGVLTLSDGTTVTLSLGDNVPVIGGYYGIVDSSTEVYTFDETAFASLFSVQDDFEGESTEATAEADAEPAVTETAE